MKTTICLFGASAILALGSAFAVPQDQAQAPAPTPEAGQPPHRQMDPNRQIKMLTKRLNLTEQQQGQILPILTDRQQQAENIRNDSSLSPKDRHEKMQSVREGSEMKLKAVLTDSQKQTYDQMRQQMRDRMRQRRDKEQGSAPAPQQQ